MAQSDKDFINRLQISQLVTDDPFADDFYCQVYTAIRNKHMQQMGIPGNMTDSGSNDGRRRGNVRTEQRMQQQVQRIVNDAKRNPKRTNGIVGDSFLVVGCSWDNIMFMPCQMNLLLTNQLIV